MARKRKAKKAKRAAKKARKAVHKKVQMKHSHVLHVTVPKGHTPLVVPHSMQSVKVVPVKHLHWWQRMFGSSK